MTRTPAAPMAAVTPAFPTRGNRSWAPSRRARHGPLRSASRASTACPRPASTAARLAVTMLFPTPPLPLITASVRATFAMREATRRCCSTTWATMPEPASPAISP